MKALLGVAALLLLAATAAPWSWNLPVDTAGPLVMGDNPISDAKVELGRRLFYDADPSLDGMPDRGLAKHSGRAVDEGYFCTPSLRNIAVTGPWWRDGSSSTLAHAIGRYPMVLPARAIEPLLAFLKALTDKQFLVEPRFARPDRACGKRL